MATAFSNLDESYIKNDLAYAAMLSYLPLGLLGLVLTFLITAFMSTISTHLNWGSSYTVNDFYVRFLKPDASEFNKVLVGRLSTLVSMICSSLLALILEEAKEAFDLLLQIGADTGLLFILRWFWNRINPYSEIVAMLSSFIIAAVFFIGKSYAPWDIESYVELIFGVVVTTIVWVLVNLFTKPTDKGTIKAFEERIFEGSNKYKNFKYKFIGFACGVYAALFATGYLIYKDFLLFAIASSICLLSTGILIANWKRIIN